MIATAAAGLQQTELEAGRWIFDGAKPLLEGTRLSDLGKEARPALSIDTPVGIKQRVRIHGKLGSLEISGIFKN